MKSFKIESKCLKLYYEFRAFIRCMKAAFSRSNFQKFLMCLLIKKLNRLIASKHVAQPLKHSAGLLRV